MKKSYDESYKYIGQVVQVSKTEDIKEGSMVLIMDHSTDCDTVYNIKEGTVDSLCDEYEFQVFPTPPDERLELMYDGLVSQVMTLTAEGWDINPNSMMDITPWLAKLKIIKIILEKESEDAQIGSLKL